MKINLAHTILFAELKKWTKQKNSFSVNDFLKERSIDPSDFEQIANNSKSFMKICREAEANAWENVKDALYTKSLPRAKIAEYIKEDDTFQGEDPEEIMRDMESAQSKLETYLTALGDTKSLRKYGRLAKINDMEALMKCSLERGVITEKQYLDFLQIERGCKENDNEEA